LEDALRQADVPSAQEAVRIHLVARHLAEAVAVDHSVVAVVAVAAALAVDAQLLADVRLAEEGRLN